MILSLPFFVSHLFLNALPSGFYPPYSTETVLSKITRLYPNCQTYKPFQTLYYLSYLQHSILLISISIKNIPWPSIMLSCPGFSHFTLTISSVPHICSFSPHLLDTSEHQSSIFYFLYHLPG